MATVDPKAAAAAVKLLAAKKITVRMPKLDKRGDPVRDPDTKRFVTEDQDLSVGHVIGLRETGDTVFIAVADGNKYQAAKPAGQADKAENGGK